MVTKVTEKLVNISIEYSDNATILSKVKNPLLCVSFFDKTFSNRGINNYLQINSQFDYLSGYENFNKELWLTSEDVRYGQTKSIAWSKSDSWLFSAIEIDVLPNEDITKKTKEAYDSLLQFVKENGYTSLIRIWNSVPRINHITQNSERYRQFCVGRHLSFINNNYKDMNFPAASAVGNLYDKLSVYIFSAKTDSFQIKHFENPNQLSAYQYPKKYSPKSPSFARATLVTAKQEQILFISGTSSILGHETLYQGDFGMQLKLSIENVNNLIEAIKKQVNHNKDVELKMLRVYLRHVKDLDMAKTIIGEFFQKSLQAQYLLADLCRTDLSIEIEGYCVLHT